MFGIGGNAISAGLNFLGGMIEHEERESQFDTQKAMSETQMQKQEEFARSGIQWRVEDAKKAGVHPLFALAGSGATFNPGAIPVGGETGIGQALNNMGQNLSRSAGLTAEQKEHAYLSNMLLRAQIRKTEGEAAAQYALVSDAALKRQQANITAVVPSGESTAVRPGDGVQYMPNQITVRDFALQDHTAGTKPGWDRLETDPDAFLRVFPQESVSEMFENPVTGLWALNKTLQQDPEFFKKSSFPFGRSFWNLSEAIWNAVNRQYHPKVQAARAAREEHDREMYLLHRRGRGNPRFIPNHRER